MEASLRLDLWHFGEQYLFCCNDLSPQFDFFFFLLETEGPRKYVHGIIGRHTLLVEHEWQWSLFAKGDGIAFVRKCFAFGLSC